MTPLKQQQHTIHFELPFWQYADKSIHVRQNRIRRILYFAFCFSTLFFFLVFELSALQLVILLPEADYRTKYETIAWGGLASRDSFKRRKNGDPGDQNTINSPQSSLLICLWLQSTRSQLYVSVCEYYYIKLCRCFYFALYFLIDSWYLLMFLSFIQ